jgi:hypothetical protein
MFVLPPTGGRLSFCRVLDFLGDISEFQRGRTDPRILCRKHSSTTLQLKMKNTLIRRIIGGLSFTSALFVFQACYGTPHDIGTDVLIEGQVKAKATGDPIKGIKISVQNGSQYQHTDAEGKFSFYTVTSERYTMRFEDSDSTQNGTFANHDTVLSNIKEKVFVNVALEEK